ncbi:uncharacterized protein LOC134199496 [Bombyx mori]|uniref:uncharacterized protein LOC134199496 n=1 Tax=Bombyx mori TaxID=7091 RepID=UPI002ED69F70
MMRRKDPAPSHTGRGKSLISIRTNQQQQRKIPPCRSMLPRSYSTPTSQNETDPTQNRGYVMRSFSSPEQKQTDRRMNSDSFYRPKALGSRTELDSDLENFEQFEDCFIDIDAEDSIGQYKSSPERDEPKKVVASLLPGSGLQKISMLPMKSETRQSLQNTRDAMKKLSGRRNQSESRLNFQPLVLNVPTRHVVSDDRSSSDVEELQISPQYDVEAADLERELDNAEHHLDKEIAIATEESDADTVS